jgi:hypothetical protein
MKVMEKHQFHDEDVREVLWEGHKDNREIVFKSHDIGAFVISKRDAIALAKEFDLVVYESGANL